MVQSRMVASNRNKPKKVSHTKMEYTNSFVADTRTSRFVLVVLIPVCILSLMKVGWFVGWSLVGWWVDPDNTTILCPLRHLMTSRIGFFVSVLSADIGNK